MMTTINEVKMLISLKWNVSQKKWSFIMLCCNLVIIPTWENEGR